MRDECRRIGAADLSKALLHADRFGVAKHLLIFERRERPIDFRVPARLPNGHVLIHERNVDIVAEAPVEPVEKPASLKTGAPVISNIVSIAREAYVKYCGTPE